MYDSGSINQNINKDDGVLPSNIRHAMNVNSRQTTCFDCPDGKFPSMKRCHRRRRDVVISRNIFTVRGYLFPLHQVQTLTVQTKYLVTCDQQSCSKKTIIVLLSLFTTNKWLLKLQRH